MKSKNKQTLSASEALYLFIGRFVTSDQEVQIGGNADVSVWAKRIVEFIAEHNLAEPDWSKWEKNGELKEHADKD